MAEVYDLDKTKRAAKDSAKSEQDPFGWKSFDKMWLDKASPQNWVCKELELGPGRPCGLWGYGGSGKSASAIAICVAVASGNPIFDHFDVVRGRVAYVSHEMGEHACIDRMRRIANGMGCEPSDLETFKLSTYPEVVLNSPNALDVYLREFAEFNLVVIDSFRRSIPGEDENESSISRHFELLAKVSEKTGCTFLLLHHTSKDDVRASIEGRKRDVRVSGRGSSVIFDGSSSIWLLEGHGKRARTFFQIRSHDLGDGNFRDYSLELEIPSRNGQLFDSSRTPMFFRASERDEPKIVSSFERVKAEILVLIVSTPGINARALVARVAGKDSQKRVALAELEEEGAIVQRPGNKNSVLYYPPE